MRSRPATSLANRSISKSSAVISRSSESIRARDSAASRARGQQLLPARAEQVAHRHLHPGGGEHGVDLALQARAQPDQLGPVPHPAAQLPGGRRGDPRLGQPAHPQQVGQVRGVALVVLHPPQREHLHPQRVRQMHRARPARPGVSAAQYQP